ncbi:MAG: alpha/beta hydrolase [Pseudomonadota bacterium]
MPHQANVAAHMNPIHLDTHPASPVQAAFLSQWAAVSRPGIRYIETETVWFRIREGGQGDQTIVLFADGPNTLEHHDPIFARLSTWTRVVAVDPPGFGFSTPKPSFDFSLRAFTDAYAQLFRTLGAGPYVPCPTCTNVYPNALIAAEHPDLVSHLVLMQALDWDKERIWTGKIVDPTGDLAKPYAGQELIYRTRAAAAANWYPNAVGAPSHGAAFLRQACACFDHHGNFCLASLIQAWFGPEVEAPRFPPFRQPTLAIWGMSDRSHRKSDKRSLLTIAPHARLIEREGLGHFPDIEDPAWFNGIVRELLTAS